MHRYTARAWLLVLVVLASAAVGGIGVGSATDTQTLTVTVVDQGNNPVGGATLTIDWDGGSTTAETRSNGKVFVDVPDDKELTISVDAAEYVRNEPFVVEPGSGDSVEIPVYENALSTVTVQDTAGRPVTNADVTLMKDGVAVIDGQTDAEGKIASGQIEVGEYELDAVKPGYLHNSTTLNVVGHVKPVVTLEQSSKPVTISVVDDYFEPPRAVPNATIQVGSIGTLRTLSNGEATIQVPVNSRPKVTISKPGYTTVSVPLTVDEEPTTLNMTLSRAPALTLRPSADRVIVGENVSIRVTDEYGDLVTGASVSVDGTQVGTTNGQGTIDVPIQSSGEQTISVDAKGTSESVTVTGFQPQTEAPDTTVASTTEMVDDTTTEPDGTGSAFGPGFGPLVALVALLALALLAGRRRS